MNSSRKLLERLNNKVVYLKGIKDDLEDAINGEGMCSEEKQAVVKKKMTRLNDNLVIFLSELEKLDTQVAKDEMWVNMRKTALWLISGIITVAGLVKALHLLGIIF